jgi:5-methylcytosine-specific restriction endonuclease McrA
MPLYGEAKREYARLWQSRRRDEWLIGKYCVWCGTTENLEVDHIDPTTKLIRITSVWGMSPLNPRRIAELEKCQVLCEHHHEIKSAIELSLKGKPETRMRETKHVFQ